MPLLPDTLHASAARSTPERWAGQVSFFDDQPLLTGILNLVPTALLFVNEYREIVFANHAALALVKATDLPVARRPGEFLGCIHAAGESGCGTTKFCRYCGAVNAILQAQHGQAGVEECRILVETDQSELALDLRVWAAPVAVNGTTFTLFACQDIGDEKRRLFLERIFLHDIRNTTSALKGFLTLLDFPDRDERSRSRYLLNVNLLSDQILDEIRSQQILLAAENGELRVAPMEFSSLDLLQEILAVYRRPDLMDGRLLAIDEGSLDGRLENDPTILKRVLGNMVKNAIEASVPGETILMGCSSTDREVAFWVQNPTYMPENIRLQVFNRSFSTKGVGRGLGTFSMKFLTERYLQGHVEFKSTEAEGTRFTASYPRRFQARKPAAG